MKPHRTVKLLKRILLKDDFIPIRQLVICLLLTALVLMGFVWKNRLASQSNNLNQSCATLTASKNLSQEYKIAQVVATNGITRNAPNEDAYRLTPLPKGTTAVVTNVEKDWLRLDYGAWISRQETQVLVGKTPPYSSICSVASRQVPGKTEVIFPLQAPVPVKIEQATRVFSVILYNTTAQKPISRLAKDPIIKSVNWQQIAPGQVKYTLILKNAQQWGYNLRYENANLILSLRHPPTTSSLSGIKILIDPGHGGIDSGAVTPSGYREKDINIHTATLLEAELVKRGATVYMTRSDDKYISLDDRVNIINKIEPAIAMSIHYNHVPEDVDAQNAKGVDFFWYHPQAQNLAKFLQNYVVKQLKRPSRGVHWKNLALARPAIAPSILLELGYMSNPEELQWMLNPQQQQKLAVTLADGIEQWFTNVQ
jgi:N-acetylmuramoyl-L-alanine amidase